MNTQALNIPQLTLRPAAALRAFFLAFARSLAFARGLEDRFDEIRRLQSLSDAELARRGIKRDAIVRHVYGDLLSR